MAITTNSSFILNNFSSSQLRLFKTCPKKWQLQRMFSIPSEDNLYFAKGRILHQALENMHLYMLENNNTLPALKGIQDFVTETMKQVIKKNMLLKKKRIKTEETLTEAQLFTERLDTLIWQTNKLIELFMNSVDYKVLEVEKEYITTWNGLQFNAIIDLLIDRNGSKVLVDFKSKSVNSHSVDMAQYAIYLKCLKDHNIDPDEIEQWDAIFVADPVLNKFKVSKDIATENIELITEDLDNALKMIKNGFFPRNEYHNMCSRDACAVWNYCRHPAKLKELAKDAEDVVQFHEKEIREFSF